MPTLAAIRAQIRALPHAYVFFTQKEVRALPGILTDDEQVLALTSGLMDNNSWLAVGTNRRVLFLNRGMVFGTRLVQIPLDRVQSIDHETGILFGHIRVWDGASYFTLRMALKSSVGPFVRAVQEAIATHKAGAGAVAAPASTADDPVARLERLAALRDRGALTEAEFQAQKAKILQE